MNSALNVSKIGIVILAIVFGFCGGIVASLFIFGLNKFPVSVIEQGHPLLSAPFLTFVGTMIVAIIFYRPIQSLLSKGSIKIKWGDKEISLSEIEGKIDAEFNEYASKLDDLDVEIQGLRSKIDSVQDIGQDDNKLETTTVVAISPEDKIPSNVTGKIKDAFDWVNSDNLATLVYHLATSKYRWRNQHTLVKKTGLTASVIDEFVRAFPEHIIRSQGKSGNIIYRLSDKSKARFIGTIELE